MSLKKKRVRKSIALVLVGVMVVTPIMNNVSAMENNYINSHIEIQENIEYFKNVETYIKELYGTEDKFYPFKVGISAVTAASVAPDVLAYLINVRNCGSYYNIIINGKSYKTNIYFMCYYINNFYN